MTPEDTVACFLQHVIDEEYTRAHEMLSPALQESLTPADLEATRRSALPETSLTQSPPVQTGELTFRTTLHGTSRDWTAHVTLTAQRRVSSFTLRGEAT